MTLFSDEHVSSNSPVSDPGGRPGLDPGTLGLKGDAYGRIRPVAWEWSLG
jgi:hypothetical protein